MHFIEEYYLYTWVRSSGRGVHTSKRRATGVPEHKSVFEAKGNLTNPLIIKMLGLLEVVCKWDESDAGGMVRRNNKNS